MSCPLGDDSPATLNQLREWNGRMPSACFIKRLDLRLNTPEAIQPFERSTGNAPRREGNHRQGLSESRPAAETAPDTRPKKRERLLLVAELGILESHIDA